MAGLEEASGRWDAVHPIDPERTFIVAGTPRSGSTLLCEAIRATGRLGVPFEYFNPLVMEWFYRRTGDPRPRPRARATQLRRRARGTLDGQGPTAWRSRASMLRYVRWLQHHRVTDGGTFSTKLFHVHWDKTRRTVGLDLLDLLQPRRVIRIRRLDYDRQAISAVRAEQNRLWHVRGERRGPDRSVFDREMILRYEARFRALDQLWDEVLDGLGVPTRQVVYEDLAADYEAVVGDCCAFLGEAGLPVPEAPLRQLADATTEEWLERLRSG